MNLTKYALEHRAVTYFIIAIILLGGLYSYKQLGQLEDPEFTVKTAAIVTQYPGASPQQVELEVTDLIETKLQEMSEVKNIYSISKAGVSIIKVDIKSEYWSDRLPQVWDVLRKKVHDVKSQLPPQASEPKVVDDYGYVFGFLLAVTGDGFSYAQLENYVKDIRKSLSLVPGVARIDLWGVQPKRIYIDTSDTQLSQLGITPNELIDNLSKQNMVVDSGSIDSQSLRYRMTPTGEFRSPKNLEDLVLNRQEISQLNENTPTLTQHGAELIRLKEVAQVNPSYLDPPPNLMRFNGMPAIGVALAPLPGVNVVSVGNAVNQRIQQLLPTLPVGIELHPISWQSEIVAQSIHDFMINLAQAIAIVLVVLALTMGIRMGLIIGVSGLLFPILGTFIVMDLMNIDLQRVSLGALIIAMGMMVDNAIVVADGFVSRLQQGIARKQAAIEAGQQPAWPLLGATVVACLAFYPIYASTYDTGEYAGSLFVVVAVSLILSWFLSQMVTTLLCVAFIPDPKQKISGDEAYNSKFYRGFRRVLSVAIRYRFLTIAGSVVLLAIAIFGFKFVPQMYFPDSSRTQFMVDFWEPEGTRIQTVSEDLKQLEHKLQSMAGVTAVSSFIGQGPPRFYLPVSPEDNDSAYAQVIVNTDSLQSVDKVMDELRGWVNDQFPQAMVRIRKYAVGAFNDWTFEARFSGPAEADVDTLRSIAQQGLDILNQSPYVREARTNWRQRVLRLALVYQPEQARWVGVDREDVANATKRVFDGLTVGLYREGDDLVPIVLRNNKMERQDAVRNLGSTQVSAENSYNNVPLSQVVSDTELKWEDPIIQRWDRHRAITVQASPLNVTTDKLRNSVLQQFEQISLPEGYRLQWDGEFDSQQESMEALLPGIVPALVMMILIIVLLFNAYRPTLIIFLVIPFVMIGITFGLLVTQVAFGFIALLGAMSLSGMVIKNAVVLLDQVRLNLAEGMPPYQGVVEAAVSRLRPVINASATTILGMIPLLQDVFWVSLAVTIMFGLLFGTVITMVLVPVLYATFYRIKMPEI